MEEVYETGWRINSIYPLKSQHSSIIILHKRGDSTGIIIPDKDLAIIAKITGAENEETLEGKTCEIIGLRNGGFPIVAQKLLGNGEYEIQRKSEVLK